LGVSDSIRYKPFFHGKAVIIAQLIGNPLGSALSSVSVYVVGALRLSKVLT